MLQHACHEEGEFFKLHGDYSTSGTRSSAGFVNSSRLATLFVYLNDIQQGRISKLVDLV